MEYTLKVGRRRSTRIAIDEAFLNALDEIATTEGTFRAAVVRRIAASHMGPNLSSAVRVCVVEHCGKAVAPLVRPEEGLIDLEVRTAGGPCV